jgi:hypothetical protein
MTARRVLRPDSEGQEFTVGAENRRRLGRLRYPVTDE